jgi:hypothetical protein
VKDISGRYTGDLFSDFKRTKEPIQIVFEITQTASCVHVRQFTRDSTGRTTWSESLNETIEARADGSMRLSFAYRNEGEATQAEMTEHIGFCCLDFSTDRKRVGGRYFTNRHPHPTRGEIHACFASKKLKGRL